MNADNILCTHQQNDAINPNCFFRRLFDVRMLRYLNVNPIVSRTNRSRTYAYTGSINRSIEVYCHSKTHPSNSMIKCRSYNNLLPTCPTQKKWDKCANCIRYNTRHACRSARHASCGASNACGNARHACCSARHACCSARHACCSARHACYSACHPSSGACQSRVL